MTIAIRLALKNHAINLIIEKLQLKKESFESIVTADGIEDWINDVYKLTRELDTAIMDVMEIK